MTICVCVHVCVWVYSVYGQKVENQATLFVQFEERQQQQQNENKNICGPKQKSKNWKRNRTKKPIEI